MANTLATYEDPGMDVVPVTKHFLFFKQGTKKKKINKQ